MKRGVAILLSIMLLSGCSALPAEDRAFAVALGISENAGLWEVGVRVPVYQTGGGYMTLSAKGSSLGEAMALLNASAPMELHYGQLRLMVFSESTARRTSFPELLRALAARGEVRPQAALAVTRDNVLDVMDALEPATGSRLSKSLETLLEAREKTGVAAIVTLDEWQRMGERQQAVLLNVAMEPGQSGALQGMNATAGELPVQGAGKAQFSGGWMMNAEGKVQGTLSAAEMQLLALLKDELHQGTLTLPEGTLTLLDTNSKLTLEQDSIRCKLRVQYSAASMTEEGVQAALISALQALAGKLSAAGCDALGIARKAVLGCSTAEDWRQMTWPEQYAALAWHFVIQVEREA